MFLDLPGALILYCCMTLVSSVLFDAEYWIKIYALDASRMTQYMRNLYNFPHYTSVYKRYCSTYFRSPEHKCRCEYTLPFGFT